MAFQLPNLSARIVADAAPLTAGFAQAKAEARRFAQAVAPDLSPKLKLDLAPMEASFNRAKTEAARTSRQIEAAMRSSAKPRAMEAVGAIGIGATGISSIDALKAQHRAVEGAVGGMRLALGGGSSLGNGLGAIGIAIGGLAFVSNRLDELAGKAQQLAIAFDQGRISAGQLGAQILTSIPIASKLGEAISTAFSIATGEAQYVAAIKEATREQEAHMKVVMALHEEVERFTSDAAARIERINAGIERMKLSGLPLKLFDIDRSTGAAFKDIQDRTAASLGSKAIKDAEADVIAAKKKLHDLQNRLANAPATVAVSGGVGGAGVVPNDREIAELRLQAVAAQNGVQSRQKYLDEQRQKILDQGSAQMGAIAKENIFAKAGAGIDAAMQKFQSMMAPIIRLQQDRDKAMSDMQRQIVIAGGDKFAGQIFDFKQLKPSTDQLNGFLAQVDQLRQKQVQFAKDKSIDDLIARLADPAAKAAQKISTLRELLNEMRITPAQFSRGLDQAKREMTAGLPPISDPGKGRLAEFLRPGTADAARFKFSLGQDSYQRQRDQTQKDLLSETKTQTGLLEKIAGGPTFTILDVF